MYAILNGLDGHLHWSKVPNPVLENGQVLLEIHAAALNRADLLQRAGEYPPPPGWPDWFGLEASGIIKEMTPDAEREGRFHVGDSVCALLGGGGYAEYAAVPEGMLMPIPKGLTMEEAAALPEAFGAAYLFLFYEGGLKRGDTVLIQAGASGLASVVIPMAKAFGARVLTTVLNEKFAKAVEHLRADRVIDTSKEDLAEIMKQEKEAGRGVDICIDCLGGETVGRCLPNLAHGGRWIMIATLAGDLTDVDLRKLYVNNSRLIGTTLRSRTSEAKKEILASMVNTIWPKVECGEIRPTIWRIYPMAQAEEAQDEMQGGKSVGKIVLKAR